jgi:transposase
MHVAKIPNRNSSPTYLLRESYREGGKVKNRTLGNITSLGAEKIALIAQVLKGEELVPASEAFEIVRTQPHGHVDAILTAIRRIGLDKMIDPQPSRQRNLVVAMIAQRIIAPNSKLATTREWENTTLARELNIDTKKENADSLYAAMDWLLKRQDKIEQKLAQHHLSEKSMVLYDISSSYVEGEHCPLAKFGQNRDKTDGKKIIVYGLMTDDVGCPISIQAYPGNTADSTTIPDQVTKIREQFGLDEITLVGDRGMLTGTQINKLKQYPGIRHISALRGESIRQLIKHGNVNRSLLDKTQLAEIVSEEFPDERLIVCYNPLLEERRKKQREELLVATEKLLTDLTQRILKRHDQRKPYSDAEIGIRVGRVADKFHVAKHVVIEIKDGQFSFHRNSESIQHESELDGLYVIRTNVPAERRASADVVRDYKRLADVEKSFRTIKTTLLDIRPIHHHLENRVRAHFLICMLSYYVVWHLRRAWSKYLFSDENLDETRSNRNPVLTATPTENVKNKKTRKARENSNKQPNESETHPPTQSFRTLLSRLATISLTQCQIKNKNENVSFNKITTPDNFQNELIKQIKQIQPRHK